MLGSLGVRGDEKALHFSIVVVANRFPAWLWNIGGCVDWVDGLVLDGNGCRWKDVVGLHYKEIKVLQVEEVGSCETTLVLSNGVNHKKLRRWGLVWEYALFDFRTDGSRRKFCHSEVGGATDGEWTLTEIAANKKFSRCLCTWILRLILTGRLYGG